MRTSRAHAEPDEGAGDPPSGAGSVARRILLGREDSNLSGQ